MEWYPFELDWLWSIQTPVLFLWERMYDSRIAKNDLRHLKKRPAGFSLDIPAF